MINAAADTLETYAKIFLMRRRYWDEQIKQFYWVGPSDVELAAAESLRFQAAAIRRQNDGENGQMVEARRMGD